MTWVLGIGLCLVLVRIVLRNRHTILVSPVEPISPLHLALSKKLDRTRKAALMAATEMLR
ncbi:MAG TPA: hypothetical protein VMK12_29520 [Anaeromyxobacteraceae bacterium]|nr:hypothetical protein [Anaeromyxobacteraceae bacterium]